MLVATKRCCDKHKHKRFVVTKIVCRDKQFCRDGQAYFCRDKWRVLLRWWQTRVCRDKTTVVLEAAPANDRWEEGYCLPQRVAALSSEVKSSVIWKKRGNRKGCCLPQDCSTVQRGEVVGDLEEREWVLHCPQKWSHRWLGKIKKVGGNGLQQSTLNCPEKWSHRWLGKSRKWEGMGYNKTLLTVLRSEVTAGWENQEIGREWVTKKHS